LETTTVRTNNHSGENFVFAREFWVSEDDIYSSTDKELTPEQVRKIQEKAAQFIYESDEMAAVYYQQIEAAINEVTNGK
jgi:hypothetical protein